jgi:hypothetical protein
MLCDCGYFWTKVGVFKLKEFACVYQLLYLLSVNHIQFFQFFLALILRSGAQYSVT